MTSAFRKLIPWSVLAVSLFAASAFAGDPPRFFDHLKCFQIRDQLTRRPVLTADISPEQSAIFGDQHCKIRLPATHLCTAVDKSNVRDRNGNPIETVDVPSTEAHDYLCYSLHCPKEIPNVDATDQFGRRILNVKRARYLCTPAELDADECEARGTCP